MRASCPRLLALLFVGASACAVSEPIPFPAGKDGGSMGSDGGSAGIDAEPSRDIGGSDPDAGAPDRGLRDADSRPDADHPDIGPSDVGFVDAGPGCSDLIEEECQQEPSCVTHYCPGCVANETFFNACTGANQLPPTCPDLSCPDCLSFGEVDCIASPSCQPQYCTDCQGSTVFVECINAGTPPVACLIPLCQCSALTKDECDRSPLCHSVYALSANDAMEWVSCGDGDQADCTGGALGCAEPEPICIGEYVVSYANLCYEGCVHISDCP